ncbi:MAG: methylenetetrahydrofolate reductase C-terminal domain-containing protein [Syntrophales bacterium]|nr:methylenetetrahydrofolate reductase C-terminal domain-containing protein [Syntrophales bacterium]
MDNRFQKSLTDPQRFTVTWELIPGRGSREKTQDDALASALQAVRGNRIDAVTITDNPGGNPAMLADCLAKEIIGQGIEPLVHFTCKDRNRNQIESQLYALDRAGIRNLLVMTGDYPVSGFQGRPAPVFDLDPIHVHQLIRDMNQGLAYPGPKDTIRHQPTEFFAGVAVSPFKATEAEQMVQYFKLKKKLSAGARFVVSQLGYDARKFHELLLFMKLNNLKVPVIGNIYVLPFGAGKLMNENRLPGCVVTGKLLDELDRERANPDKGLEARLLRAAKMYAFMKGMGFSGVHIAGHGVKYEQVVFIIERGEELSVNWQDLIHEFDYPQPGGFYVFEKDASTGLNLEIPISLKNRPSDFSTGFVYSLSRLLHRLIFAPGKGLFGLMQGIAKKVAGSSTERILRRVEHLTKFILYDCRDCGDCALVDIAYTCPMSGCPKNQRNGACGGSRDGWCEVYPGERLCIYVKAYARLKNYGEEGTLDADPIPACNWNLFQSSSWINYYLGRDHSAGRLGIKKHNLR